MKNIEFLKNSQKFTNVIQSPLWKNIESKFAGKIVFILFLYYDDVEPKNETGSHSGGHKLGAVYYEIQYLPQNVLSSLENIFAAAFF